MQKHFHIYYHFMYFVITHYISHKKNKKKLLQLMSEFSLYIRKSTGICTKVSVPMYLSIDDLKIHLHKVLSLPNQHFHLEAYGKQISETIKSPICQFISPNTIVDVVVDWEESEDMEVQCILGQEVEIMVVGRKVRVGEFKEPTCRVFGVNEEEVELFFGNQVFPASANMEQILETLEQKPPLTVQLKPIFPTNPENRPPYRSTLLNKLAHSIVSQSEQGEKNTIENFQPDIRRKGGLKVKKKLSCNVQLRKAPVENFYQGKRSLFLGKIQEKIQSMALKMSQVKSTISQMSQQTCKQAPILPQKPPCPQNQPQTSQPSLEQPQAPPKINPSNHTAQNSCSVTEQNAPPPKKELDPLR